ncbi:capsular polysaccharide biosynthesis protein [Gynuella sunshinyii YC6258]|uniref:Capsular polysaccharide biosynthesis protein n=2 Tax=Gynuella sunshinyii TaxID=1445505 RepID=A0A0C5VHK8_9GAMM|nr:capsular polysaccharide biosynthesis protein [Gynuella sunshinyii YC6258]
MPEGEITIRYTGHFSVSESRDITRKRRSFNRILKRLKNIWIDDKIVIDFRKNTPANWAHTLNFHIPFAFFVLDQIRQHELKEKPVFVLSERTPTYIKNVFAMFELPTMFSDADIEARLVEFNQNPFDCLRTPAISWIQQFILPSSPWKKLEQTAYDLPRRVFLSRRDSRNIRNEAEIEQLLGQYGYQKIYPEDLTVAQQLQIFIHAEAIAAIHGAAIGPMLYRPASKTGLKFLEIFSPGHMTNYYRGMADQIGAEWIGVRGRLEPGQVAQAYNFNQAFLKHSLTSFEACPESIRQAIDQLGLYPEAAENYLYSLIKVRRLQITKEILTFVWRVMI